MTPSACCCQCIRCALRLPKKRATWPSSSQRGAEVQIKGRRGASYCGVGDAAGLGCLQPRAAGRARVLLTEWSRISLIASTAGRAGHLPHRVQRWWSGPCMAAVRVIWRACQTGHASRCKSRLGTACKSRRGRRQPLCWPVQLGSLHSGRGSSSLEDCGGQNAPSEAYHLHKGSELGVGQESHQVQRASSRGQQQCGSKEGGKLGHGCTSGRGEANFWMMTVCRSRGGSCTGYVKEQAAAIDQGRTSSRPCGARRERGSKREQCPRPIGPAAAPGTPGTRHKVPTVVGSEQRASAGVRGRTSASARKEAQENSATATASITLPRQQSI